MRPGLKWKLLENDLISEYDFHHIPEVKQLSKASLHAKRDKLDNTLNIYIYAHKVWHVP